MVEVSTRQAHQSSIGRFRTRGCIETKLVRKEGRGKLQFAEGVFAVCDPTCAESRIYLEISRRTHRGQGTQGRYFSLDVSFVKYVSGWTGSTETVRYFNRQSNGTVPISD